MCKERKRKSIEIFDDAKFTLHKWWCLEDGGAVDKFYIEETLAKQQLGTKPGKSKILGLPWNKEWAVCGISS